MMYVGIALLCLSYICSQFFRSFLAVLSNQLSLDLGASADQLALASGLWFLAFSAMQIPIGWALDKFGPRLTAGLLFVIGGGGGAALFAAAQAVWHLHVAMALLGVGCAPVLMGAYFIFARLYPAKVFATLAAVMVGVGSLGNLAGSAPLVYAVQALGWREAMAIIAALSVAIGAGLLLFVRNPEPLSGKAEGSLLDLLRLRALWLILPLMLMSYAPAAGLRGVWIGPYLTTVHGAGPDAVGRAAMIMSLAMIVAHWFMALWTVFSKPASGWFLAAMLWGHCVWPCSGCFQTSGTPALLRPLRWLGFSACPIRFLWPMAAVLHRPI